MGQEDRSGQGISLLWKLCEWEQDVFLFEHTVIDHS